MISHTLIIYSFASSLLLLPIVYVLFNILRKDPRARAKIVLLVLALPLPIFIFYQYILNKPCAITYLAYNFPAIAPWLNQLCVLGLWLAEKLMPLVVIALIISMIKVLLGIWYTKNLINDFTLNKEKYQYLQRVVEKECFHLNITAPQLIIVPIHKAKAFVYGTRKPAVIITQGLINQLTPEEMNMVLIHELAHIKERHILGNLVAKVFRDLMIYNPLIHLCYGLFQKEQERAADLYVLERTNKPIDYAALLLKMWKLQRKYTFKELLLENLSPSPNFIGLGYTLDSRIKMALGFNQQQKGSNIWLYMVLMVLYTTLFLAFIC